MEHLLSSLFTNPQFSYIIHLTLKVKEGVLYEKAKLDNTKFKKDAGFWKTFSVPILKLVINQHNIKTKVDLTFDLENPKIIINYYTNILKKNPEIKPLTLIIKKLISKNHLNRVFEGGLSSHSILHALE